MTTKTTKPEQPDAVDDLRGLRAAVDAPLRAEREAEQAHHEAVQWAQQTAVGRYGRGVLATVKIEPSPVAAWAKAAPATSTPVLRGRRWGPELLEARDRATAQSIVVPDLAALVPAATAALATLDGPDLLPPDQLTALLAKLDGWAARAQSRSGDLAGWTRTRAEAAQLLRETAADLAAHAAWLQPSAEDLAALAAHQQTLADAAASQPPIPVPAPRRRVGGADYDAAPQTRTPARRPLLENLED